MEEIERMVAELSIDSFEVESMHWVEVTHIIDPFTFYIRLNKYKSFIQILESMEPTTKCTCLNLHDLVIFNMGHSCGARKYIRGRISSILTGDDFMECEIFAIDYGFSEKLIPIEYIWECSQDLAKTPPLAYDCQLANCYPIRSEFFSLDTVNAFRYYASIEPIKMKVLGKKPHKLLVDLIISIPESIATLLAIGGYSMLGYYYDPIAWSPIVGQKRMFFNFKKLTVDEIIHVKYLSGDSTREFHVAEVSDFKKHLNEVDFISFYARREFSLSPVHLIEGTLVCVKIDDKNIYERAFIKKVTKPKESAIVQLVDWGRDEEFPVGKMKYMSSQCLRTPVLSIYCKVEESQACDSGLEDMLFIGNEFNITMKKLGHEFECPNTVAISHRVDLDEARALCEVNYE
ncbi:uncharacterized protein LOC123668528 [Melitaea cinxia]|uniref:uncharacterized protein LOC123668528 n=1 Tax=Melitaea cinxia TaxID=113334 RepID=UPI001E2701F3|nr:uncharacterized protein LOC123668528 [Melitaea cinxia]